MGEEERIYVHSQLRRFLPGPVPERAAAFSGYRGDVLVLRGLNVTGGN